MNEINVISRLRLIALTAILPALPIYDAGSHSGGTNAAGCHTNRRTGDYHCHTPKASRPNQITYCHVVNSEYRCGYTISICRSLVGQFGGQCVRD